MTHSGVANDYNVVYMLETRIEVCCAVWYNNNIVIIMNDN